MLADASTDLGLNCVHIIMKSHMFLLGATHVRNTDLMMDISFHLTIFRSINGKQISVLISSPGLRVWRSVKKVQQYGKRHLVSSADCLPLNMKPEPTTGVLADVAGDLTAGDIWKDVDSVILSAYLAGN